MKLSQPLIISFLVHACLYLLVLTLPQDNTTLRQSQDIEIIYQSETQKQKTREVVVSPEEKLRDAIKKLKTQAERLSLNTQRVDEETVAKQGSTTKNHHRLRRAQKNNNPPQESDAIRPNINTLKEDLTSDTKLDDSSISNYIPEVRAGGFTALNTDQFVHYTFYARTHEQIRNRWVAMIRNFLNSTTQTEINRLSYRPQISQIEIILTPGGDFVRAFIHQKSQNSALDESAISAFRLAAPFNNPPSEMIESDGYIHLHYSFRVYFSPKYFANGTK